jgi:hypothetical protein
MFSGVSPRYSSSPYQVAVNNWGVSHLFQHMPCSEIDIDSIDSDEPAWPTSAKFCIAPPNTTTWSTSCSRPAQRTEKLRRSDSLLSSERGKSPWKPTTSYTSPEEFPLFPFRYLLIWNMQLWYPGEM